MKVASHGSDEKGQTPASDKTCCNLRMVGFRELNLDKNVVCVLYELLMSLIHSGSVKGDAPDTHKYLIGLCQLRQTVCVYN